jgi:hypothetical protein
VIKKFNTVARRASMSRSIRYYGVQSCVHRDLYVKVEPHPQTRFGLDGKRWHAYTLLQNEDVRLKGSVASRRANYVFVDPSSRLDGHGLIDAYLVSAEQENVKILIPACRFEAF